MTTRTAIVVGGGIGGLTSAVALKDKGWDVTLIERAASLDPVGSGMALGPNALRALDTLGLGDPVRELAAFQGDGGIRRASGAWLSRTSAEAAAARFGDPTVLLMRATVVDLLTARLDGGELRLGTSVTSVDAESGTVVTADGAEARSDLVVAADGIHSAIRKAAFPGHPEPRYSGLTAWRFVVDADEAPMPSETWGRGLVFGVMPLAGNRVYCYATAVAPAGGTAPDGEKAELTRLFGTWHAPIPELIGKTGDILRNDVFYLHEPLPAMHRGKVAILGDAAHPMTPNLGQGACQAIEDAIVLAHEMTDGGGLPAYTRARLPRTSAIVKKSAGIARLSKVSNPAAVAGRDAVMRALGLLGPTALLRQGDAVFNWDPPHAGAVTR
ncbi:FAD-dependent monooxygenase [Actinomadura rupiterrae]|uniref:FAD-dependent monooxygenase n=1 Tax=Actinomadura rupiterrae TaxID=559627 RepID=UPI0020A4C338|nr:FAD-dependent monooxygenase [Actinomadura rupiterrae]MCP2340730.1 2-polyprenyl-6-methoxyphenol hydroxylase-like FAD-dependent oxidoreductase [Actinomadura rupiterrae]